MVNNITTYATQWKEVTPLGNQQGKLILTAIYHGKQNPVFLYEDEGKKFATGLEMEGKANHIDHIDFIAFLTSIQFYWMQKGLEVELIDLVALFDEIEFDI